MAKVTPPSAISFKALFTEFANCDDSLCEGFLAFAALELDAALFPNEVGTMACMYGAAHNIALSPAGRAMQLVSKDGSTVYGDRFNALKRRATMGLRCP
jgi:hypothetical protein